MSEKSMNADQQQQMTRAANYLERNRITTLFNELISKVVIDKPDNINDFLITELKKVKANYKQSYFQDKDFRLIFENYNILNNSSKFTKLIHKSKCQIILQKETAASKGHH